MSDLERIYKQRHGDNETIEADAFMDNLINQQPQQPQQLPKEEPGSGVVRDIARGITEIPTQVAGGVIDMINNTFDLAQESVHWMNTQIGSPFNIEKESVKLPTTPEAESTTGGIVRGVSTFVSGFLGPGKIKAIKNVRNMGLSGRLTADAAQGFVSDFINVPEKNLSALIQEYPQLENPVSEFLAYDGDDTKFDQRIKSSLEGLGLGLATDGFFSALKTLKQSKKVKDAIVKENIVPESKLSEEAIAKATDTSILGDKSKPLFRPPTDVDPKQAMKETTQEQGDVFINWARIDSDDDLKSLIQNMADHSKDSIDKARRGVRSWEQTKLSAEKKDAWQILVDLNQRGKGATLNAEESLALRELWVRSADKLQEAAQLAAVDSSDSAQFAFRKMLSVHGAIQEKTIAARTETARALNQWKIPAGGTLENILDFKDVMSMQGGSDVSQALAKELVKLSDNPSAMDAFTRGSIHATTMDSVSQLWYFALLSGPHTHMRNSLSNFGTTIINLAERKIASMIGNNVAENEASAMLFGMVEGFKNSFRITSKGFKTLGNAATQTAKGQMTDAKQILKDNADEFGAVYKTAVTGQTGYGTGGKLQYGRTGNIKNLVDKTFSQPISKLDTSMPSYLRSASRILDTAMRFGGATADAITAIPGRSLSTADEFFKSINYSAEIHAQSARRAAQAVRNGDIPESQLKDYIADLVQDPDEFMRIAATKQGEYLTFTNNPSSNSRIWKALRATGDIPVFGKIVLPFTRVVYNIGSYTFERTPVAPMVKRWKDEIAQGGATKEIAQAKLVLGMSAILTAADFSIRGNITGAGPEGMNEVASLRRSGWMPESIKVGDRYYSYRGLEPMSSPLGIAANMVEILAASDDDDDVEVEELLIATFLAVGNKMVNQQYLMGVSNLFEGMSDPTRKGEFWVTKTLSAFVPAGVAQMQRFQDPDMKQIESIWDGMRARLPMENGIPYKYDLWGRRISIRSGLGEVYDAISPIYSKVYEPEPIDLELQAIEYFPQNIPKKLSFNGVKIDMGKHQNAWADLKELSGNKATETINGVPIDPITNKGLMDTLNLLVQDKHPGYPMYKYLTPTGKRGQIQNVIEKFRNASKELVLEKYPKLKAEVEVKSEEAGIKYEFLR